MARKIQDDVVVLQRLHPSDYVVNYIEANGKPTTYRWLKPTAKRDSIQEVPREVYDYLVTNTQVFQKGRLVVVDAKEKEDLTYEIGEELPEVLSITQLEEILNMKNADFKKAIEKMDKINLNALADVAINTKEDSSTKKKLIAKAIGVDEDLLFNDEV